MVIVAMGCFAAGVFLGISLATGDQPKVVVRNVRPDTIPRVRVETDIGESHIISTLKPHDSRRIKISGRDKALWIVATLEDGRELRSQKIYSSWLGFVFVVISQDAIDLDNGL